MYCWVTLPAVTVHVSRSPMARNHTHLVMELSLVFARQLEVVEVSLITTLTNAIVHYTMAALNP